MSARIASLAIVLVILGVILYFVSSWQSDSESGGQGPGLFLLLLVYLLWTNLTSGAVGRTVIINSSARRITAGTDIFGLPLKRFELPFDQIRRVLVNARVPVLSAQTGARAVWQVAIEPVEGSLFVASSNGTHSQMLALGTKIARLIGQPVVDELSQVLNPDEPPPVTQPIQDFSGGGMPSYAPPVAAPIPLGRRVLPAPPASKQPPANTLTIDSAESERTEVSLPAPAPARDRSGQDIPFAPTISSAGPPPDMGQTAMPSMPSIGMSDTPAPSGMPSMPPLGSASGMGQTFSMPPLGSLDAGMELGRTAYSPPPLTMPDQPPLGSPGGGPGAPQASPTLRAESPSGSAGSSWVRPRTEDELQQATRDDPTDSRAFYETARLWHARGDYERALNAYLQAIHLDPASAPAQNDLGVLYLQRGKYKEAEASFRRASGLDPFFVIGHYNLGLLLARTRRGAEARQALTRGQQTAANDAERQLFDNALRGVFAPPQMSPV